MENKLIIDGKKPIDIKKETYAEIWGDVVDIKHLACAILIGLIISLSFYIIGVKIIHLSLPTLTPSLNKAYGLLIGMLGSLLSAIISAKLFKPKRIINEGSNYVQEDQHAVIKELGIDLKKEAELLKNADPQIIEEMKQLGIYDLFAGKNNIR